MSIVKQFLVETAVTVVPIDEVCLQNLMTVSAEAVFSPRSLIPARTSPRPSISSSSLATQVPSSTPAPSTGSMLAADLHPPASPRSF